MLNVSQVDQRIGRDWPYTEKQMQQQKSAAAQRDYPAAGRPAARRRSA